MKHFFIIAGGKIEDAFAIEVLKGFAEKTVIAADSGMEFLRRPVFLHCVSKKTAQKSKHRSA